MYDTILVPTDGSTAAETAARHGVALATAFDSDLHVLSVVDERTYRTLLDGADIEAATGTQREGIEAHATEALKTVEALAAESSVPCHTAVEHGIPHERILSYAHDHGVDLLSMGTHGRTGLDRLFLGSVTERVVRTSDAPVLTTHADPADPSGYDRILVPTDGSEPATAAIEHAVAIARRYDATVHALSVLDIAALPGVYDAGPGISHINELLRDRCEQSVAAVAEECADHDLDVVTDVVQGAPYRAIREYVDDADIDLVVMGSHGRTGLERYLIGSVTERVVRTSDAPVLTVR